MSTQLTLPFTSKNWLFLPVLTALTLSGCGSTSSDSDTALGSIASQLATAEGYIDDSLPNLGNSVGATAMTSSRLGMRRPLDVGTYTTNFIYTSVWGSLSTAEQTFPPGGPAQSGETYGGAALPATVNYRDYIKLALDADFTRGTGGGTFRPTVFGRFDQLIDGMEYIDQSGIPTDGNGLPDVGNHTGSLTLQGSAIAIEADVTASANTTNYDRNMDVRGYLDTNSNGLVDTGETKVFHNLIWLKATSTQLNMMLAELRDSDEDATLDWFAVNMLAWNRSTGNLRFERASLPNDSNGNSVDTSRILIEGTGGKAWVYSFDATAGATGFTQWGLYTPTNAATKGTVSIREIRSNGDIWMGNICATFLTGLGEAGEAIPDDATPAGGGTCAGQVNDALLIKGALMYPGSQMQTFVTWDQLATVKGFPYSTASNWDTEGNRAAWLTAGESIAPAFSSLSQFIGSF